MTSHLSTPTHDDRHDDRDVRTALRLLARGGLLVVESLACDGGEELVARLRTETATSPFRVAFEETIAGSWALSGSAARPAAAVLWGGPPGVAALPLLRRAARLADPGQPAGLVTFWRDRTDRHKHRRWTVSSLLDLTA